MITLELTCFSWRGPSRPPRRGSTSGIVFIIIIISCISSMITIIIIISSSSSSNSSSSCSSILSNVGGIMSIISVIVIILTIITRPQVVVDLRGPLDRLGVVLAGGLSVLAGGRSY